MKRRDFCGKAGFTAAGLMATDFHGGLFTFLFYC
jgi:hypothetical protein